MMSFDRYLNKFLYLAAFTILAASAFVVGCGGGNNPGGPIVVATNDTAAQIAGSFNILGQVVTENQKPVAGLNVSLYITDSQTGAKIATPVKTMTSLSTGEFTFRNIATGTYIVEVSGSLDYYDSSKLAIVENETNVNIGALVVTAKPVDPTIPTLNLTARVVDPLSGNPFSVADISVDTGQATVSDYNGVFTLPSLASGVRTLKVSQPGLASYSLVFEVLGNTGSNLATAIKFNNVTYAVNSGANTVNMLIYGKNLEVNPNLHASAVLMGTVKKFVLNEFGDPTNLLEPYPYFEFELWQIDLGKGLTRKFDSIISGPDGTWRRDQLPPYEDNSFHWFATPPGTSVTVTTDGGGGTTVVFNNPNWPASAGEAVLTFGYIVSGGQTTVMDFTVPSVIYRRPAGSTITPITDARLSVDGGVTYATNADALSNGNLDIQWTQPDTATKVAFEVYKLNSSSLVPDYSKAFNINGIINTVNNQTLSITSTNLGIGRYQYAMRTYDPATPTYSLVSTKATLNIMPANTTFIPANGTNITVQTAASYTVDFTVPYDSSAKSAVLEIYTPANTLIGTSQNFTVSDNKATFNYEFPANTPAAANGYTWKVKFIYHDGVTIYTDTGTINFN
ncbi:MAG: hypothetical protein Kow0029_10920 [Candidatus Rifleibacteriota bacterium]